MRLLEASVGQGSSDTHTHSVDMHALQTGPRTVGMATLAVPPNAATQQAPPPPTATLHRWVGCMSSAPNFAAFSFWPLSVT